MYKGTFKVQSSSDTFLVLSRIIDNHYLGQEEYLKWKS